nr:reverse transcriptase domain-containing protein [Tanacetum cinerariifolium]
MFKQIHINITLADALILIPKYQKMLKALLSNKEKLQELANTPLNENCSAVILKKLPEKLRDPGKFIIQCGFSELKCKALVDLEGGNILPEKLLDLDSTKDLHPPHHFDIEFDLKEIEYLLYHDPIKDIDSILKDSIDQSNLVDLNDNLVDSMPEMFTDEHALNYSSLSLYDEYDDDLFKVKSDTKNVYDDPFDSKGEKIKESKLLIDELDLLCDFLPSFEYVSILSKDFSKVDALPSTNNEDKLAISHAYLMIEDFDPPLYELPFFKEVPSSSKEELVQAKRP